MQKIKSEYDKTYVEPPRSGGFTEVKELTFDELSLIIADVAKAEAFDLIFCNDVVEVYRYFNRPGRDLYSIFFIAERLGLDQWCMTSGIGYCAPQKVYAWEKEGKKKLVMFLKEHWNVRF
jgi:hypothetical protein